MLAAIIAPPASLPEALQYLAWAAGAVVAIVAVTWRGFVWLLNRIDERFKAAIRGEDFEAVVDKRVSAAFDGALRPLMGANADLAAKIQTVKDSADAAHRRMDEHLERQHA